MEERHMRELLEILRGIMEAIEDVHKDLLALNQTLTKPKPIVASSRAMVTLGTPVTQ